MDVKEQFKETIKSAKLFWNSCRQRPHVNLLPKFCPLQTCIRLIIEFSSVTFALNKFPIAFLHPRAFRKLLCLFWKMWTSGCGCSLFPGPRAILRLLLVLYLDCLGATLRNAQPAFLHISRNDVVPKLERFRGKQWKVGLVQGAHSRLSCHRLFPSQTVIYIRVSDYAAALVNLKNTHTQRWKPNRPLKGPQHELASTSDNSHRPLILEHIQRPNTFPIM